MFRLGDAERQKNLGLGSSMCGVRGGKHLPTCPFWVRRERGTGALHGGFGRTPPPKKFLIINSLSSGGRRPAGRGGRNEPGAMRLRRVRRDAHWITGPVRCLIGTVLSMVTERCHGPVLDGVAGSTLRDRQAWRDSAGLIRRDRGSGRELRLEAHKLRVISA